MNLHLAFLLNTILCALAFAWGRSRTRKSVGDYPRRYPWETPAQRQLSLFRIQQAGRIAMITSMVIWLMLAAAYLLLIIQFVPE